MAAGTSPSRMNIPGRSGLWIRGDVQEPARRTGPITHTKRNEYS